MWACSRPLACSRCRGCASPWFARTPIRLTRACCPATWPAITTMTRYTWIWCACAFSPVRVLCAPRSAASTVQSARCSCKAARRSITTSCPSTSAPHPRPGRCPGRWRMRSASSRSPSSTSVGWMCSALCVQARGRAKLPLSAREQAAWNCCWLCTTVCMPNAPRRAGRLPGLRSIAQAPRSCPRTTGACRRALPPCCRRARCRSTAARGCRRCRRARCRRSHRALLRAGTRPMPCFGSPRPAPPLGWRAPVWRSMATAACA